MRFLLFRLPQENRFYKVEHCESRVEKASFFSFLKGKKMSLFSDEMQEITAEEVREKMEQITHYPQAQKINIPTQEQYLEKVNRAIDEVRKNHWQKLVISRPVEVPFCSDGGKLATLFLELCERFPQAFCYVWRDENCLWIGATPELLGKFDREKSTFNTMSLAGTLPIDEEWTEKEIKEQQAVTDYISLVLKTYADEVEIGQTKNHILGKIKHLKTDFLVKIDEEKLEHLIRELHPTPAVCGIPKEDCQQKIIEIEGYNREYYTGYIRIETEEKTYFFVNLRCMQVFDNKIIAYAGGGITSHSNAQKEWQETEMKVQSILSIESV